MQNEKDCINKENVKNMEDKTIKTMKSNKNLSIKSEIKKERNNKTQSHILAEDISFKSDIALKDELENKVNSLALKSASEVELKASSIKSGSENTLRKSHMIGNSDVALKERLLFYSYDTLIESSIKSTKPHKENPFNCSYRFPNYLSKPKNLENSVNWNFLRKRNLVEYLNPPKPAKETKNYKINIEKHPIDRRTTCMIKNIPNKYTSDMLVSFINETHFGKYTFLYLRMDFKNKCNVGYAFVDFIDCISVRSFYQRVNGKGWKNFTSGKIAELTYASIQGLENLKKKFRNSLVMLEDKSFRPKLFYTEGSNKGFEKPEFD
jgi:RNA recognition motif 2